MSEDVKLPIPNLVNLATVSSYDQNTTTESNNTNETVIVEPPLVPKVENETNSTISNDTSVPVENAVNVTENTTISTPDNTTSTADNTTTSAEV